MKSDVTFDDRGCEEWGLKLKEFEIQTPEVKTSYVEIKGMNGSLDATDNLGVFFEDREISLTFDHLGNYESWNTDMMELCNYLHGKKKKVVMNHDSEYYYEGRLWVKPSKTNEILGTVTITGRMYPYKLRRNEYLKKAAVSNSILKLINDPMPASPVIVTDTDMQVVVNGDTYNLTTGWNEPEFELTEGENILEFIGTGNVEISWRGGSL